MQDPVRGPVFYVLTKESLSSQLIHCDRCKAEFWMFAWNWEVGSGMRLLSTFTFHEVVSPGKGERGRCRWLLNHCNIRVALHGKK